MHPANRRFATVLTLGLALILAVFGATRALAAPSAAMPAVTIQATEYAFTAPDQIEGGVTAITYQNMGQAAHNLIFYRLKDGKTLADFQAAKGAAASAAVADLYGGLSRTFPGQTQQVVLDLAEGQYVIISVTAGQDHVPDVAKGMSKAIAVRPSTRAPGADAPAADYTVSIKDFAPMPLPPTIPAGRHTFEVRSDGTLPHQMIVVQLQTGKTVADFTDWIRAHQAGPPPLQQGGGGTNAFSPGKHGWLTLDLAPGNYVAWSDYPGAKPGEDDFLEGVGAPFTVTAPAPGMPATGAAALAGLNWLLAAGGLAVLSLGMAVALRRRAGRPS